MEYWDPPSRASKISMCILLQLGSLPKIIVRNCRNLVNAFMQTNKKGAFTNSVDPDETPHFVASH